MYLSSCNRGLRLPQISSSSSLQPAAPLSNLLTKAVVVAYQDTQRMDVLTKGQCSHCILTTIVPFEKGMRYKDNVLAEQNNCCKDKSLFAQSAKNSQ